jgi:hypothetical protein
VQARNDTRRHSLLEAERIADRNCELAHARQLVGELRGR